MIRKSLFPIVFLLTSAPAFAHAGHDHFGNEVIHHTLEGLAVLAVAAVSWVAYSRMRARNADHTDTRGGQ